MFHRWHTPSVKDTVISHSLQMKPLGSTDLIHTWGTHDIWCSHSPWSRCNQAVALVLISLDLIFLRSFRRSSVVVPPQIPSKRSSRARVKHCDCTAHVEQILLARRLCIRSSSSSGKKMSGSLSEQAVFPSNSEGVSIFFKASILPIP